MRVFLLPGLDGTGELFADFIARRPQDFETEVLSYPPDTPVDYPGCARLVLERLDTRSPFVLVAESFSGPVAVLAAHQQPAGLAGVVLCNTFVAPPAWSGFRFLPWGLLMRLGVPRLTVALHLTGRIHAARFVDAVRAANRKAAPRVRAARMRAALSVDVCAQLAELEVPVMYLRGTRDRLVGPWAAARAQACRPDARLVELDGPHLLLQVLPDECWRAIGGFVDAVAGHPPCSTRGNGK